MATKKPTKKEIKEYAEDRFFEVFGQLDDFETEYQLMREGISAFRTKAEVDECLEILLEVYKQHMEEWSPIPKALEE